MPNESSEIIRMFNSAFEKISVNELDLYPRTLRTEIDELNALIYENVNNGVYKIGFATPQKSYTESCMKLFECLGELKQRLSITRFLLSDKTTETDWWLFTTLVRFDAVYVGHFKCNKKGCVIIQISGATPGSFINNPVSQKRGLRTYQTPLLWKS